MESAVADMRYEETDQNSPEAVLPQHRSSAEAHRFDAPRDAKVAFNRPEARTRDLLAALAYPFRQDPLKSLRRSLQEMFGREHIYFAPSGQCAIAQIVAMLPQKEVVMPAYMCYQVRHAIAATGKKIIYVDVARNGVNSTAAEFEEAARPGRILVAAHLFGAPTDIEAICELARKRDCVTIEDAVPAFSGRHNGRLLGTIADFGVFSFHHSKRMSAFSGAVIVVNNAEIINPLALDSSRIIQTKLQFPLTDLGMGIAQNIGTFPWVYRSLTLPLLPLRHLIPEMLHKLRRKKDTPSESMRAAGPPSVPHNRFFTREVHPYQAEILLSLVRRMDGIRDHISRLVHVYQEVFQNTSIVPVVSADCDAGAMMRFPVVFPGKDRDEVLRRAEQYGLQLKSGWRGTLSEESENSRFPNAVWVSRNVTLLPLYTGLSLKSAECLARSLVQTVNQLETR
jgi:dTDP-4-amino-4,6-dideoxygalactose transaminase